jgi:gamma-glutamylcyclotransferase (GGCT)/AIG2-like uncharacterized protein YtfP
VPPADPLLLFVYGTLMRDGRNHRALAGQRFLGPARTQPLYALLDLGAYPGLVRHEPGRAVAGELYAVPAALVERLDRIEGAPTLFHLGPVAVAGVEGPAFAYFYQPAAAGVPLCAGDRWELRRPRGGDP